MLILRAFPLSFSILWRFIIVLPILLICLGMYLTFAVTWGIFFGLIWFVVTILLFLALSFIMALIPTLIGTRLGLQAKGETVRGHYGRVLKAALGYGAFEAVARLVLTVGAAGVVVLITPGLSPENFQVFALELVQTTFLGGAQPGGVGANGVSANGVAVLVTVLLFAMLRAALLPALAGGAACSDPGSSFHTPFSGFGSSFIWLALLIIITYILPFVLIPLGVWAVIAFDLTGPFINRFMELQPVFLEVEEYSFAMIDGYVVAGIIVFGLWLFSLQCAGAVLAYSTRRAAYDSRMAEQPEVERMDPDELREMVRSRMPQRKY